MEGPKQKQLRRRRSPDEEKYGYTHHNDDDAYGSVGVNSGSSSVKSGSKLSQSFSRGGRKGGITCLDSNYIQDLRNLAK